MKARGARSMSLGSDLLTLSRITGHSQPCRISSTPELSRPPLFEVGVHAFLPSNNLTQESIGARVVMHLSPAPGAGGGPAGDGWPGLHLSFVFPQHPIQATNLLLPPIILIFLSGEIATTQSSKNFHICKYMVK
jgi:hypothetical protein